MGCHFLLQGIYPTQESNPRLLHLRDWLVSLALADRSFTAVPLGKTYMLSASCEMLSWMNHKLESRLLGEISISSDMQTIPSQWSTVKRLSMMVKEESERAGLKFNIPNTKITANRWGKSGSSDRFYFLAAIGKNEDNGNPLQYYCLENPRDRGAWLAAVYGVAQNQTRLKRLSSSSSRSRVSSNLEIYSN